MKHVVDVARAMGREIATPAEASSEVRAMLAAARTAEKEQALGGLGKKLAQAALQSDPLPELLEEAHFAR